MRVLLLDAEKITKINLPEEIVGTFLMPYKLVNSKMFVDIIFEASDEGWLIKSTNYISVIGENNFAVDYLLLKEFSHFNVILLERQEILEIYTLPIIDSNCMRGAITTEKIEIGTNTKCSIVYNNSNISDVHLSIIRNQNNWFAVPTEDHETRIYLNYQRILKATPIYSGDVIFFNGLKIIWMQTFLQVNNPFQSITLNSFVMPNLTEDNYDNTLFTLPSEEESSCELYKAEDYFFHTPNLKQYLTEKNIDIEEPPQSEIPQDNGLLTSTASITLLASSFTTGFSVINNISSGAKLTQIIPSVITFIAMLIGSLMMPKIAKIYNDRTLKRREKYRVKKYMAYLEYKASTIKTEMNKQTQILNDNFPPVMNVLNTFSTNSNIVWSREIKDDDFLQVRLGLGNTEAKIIISAPEEHFTLYEDEMYEQIYNVVNSSRTLENVPITFSFLENKISAVICRDSMAQKFIDCLFAQIAIYHSASDLKIVFLTTKNGVYDFSYAKFLPHCFNENKNLRLYSETADEMKVLSAYLMDIYKARTQDSKKEEEENNEVAEEKEDQKSFRKYDTYYLIVTNDFMNVKSLPITETILKSDDNYGFSFLIIDNSMRKLPNQCKAFVDITEKDGCIIEKNLNNQTMFVPEFVDVNMRAICSKLLNIPLLEVDEQASLPTSLTFLEMFGASKIEQLNIQNRWKSNDPTISLATPIGVHTSGEQFTLDLHEKAQGPHGLIAGSTGSGKSEFIITFILSMCISFHPDEVQFVLIDYKGGGLAGAFEKKDIGRIEPHIAGTITNLDAGQINRSLVSINSELKRRQKVFNDSKTITGESTIDIYKYQKYYREGIVKEPISHLFIISDEFAELKAQQPEFMDELVSTARIGRSLGVHLILATQKPSGVVNEQIWSNTRFRVSLKVASRADSMEILKRPEAASIKETGRFYLQVGYDEYFDIGQSGWAGAKYIPTDRVIKKVDDSIKFIGNTGNIIKTANTLIKKETAKDIGDQLTNIVNYLMDLAEKNNYKPRKLWLDSIPEYIYIGNLTQKYKYSSEPYIFAPIIGEYDDPEGQKQDLLTLDVSGNGNTIIYGSSGAGQDNLLSTIIFSTVCYHTPEEINFYIMDLGAETLKVYNKMPHIGDICTLDDLEKITNLMVMLDKELDHRKELFSDFNGEYSYYIKKSGQKLPYIVCIINNYDVFLENFRKMGELLEPFYRDCSKYGISFIVTCSTGNVIRSKVAEYFRNKICLRMGKDDDYRNILGSPKGLVPENYKGRGIIKILKKCYEFQSAYIYTPDLITDTIKETSQKLTQKYSTYKIKRIPVLPKIVTLDYVESDLNGLEKVPIGFDINSKTSFTYDFAKERVNIICGNSLDYIINFIYPFSALLGSINLLEVNVIDFTKKVDILQTGGKLISTDYDNVIRNIYNSITNDSTSKIKRLYLFVGLAKIKDVISNESYELYKIFMKNLSKLKNTTIIIVEEYEGMKKLQLEPWFLSSVNKNVGIWYGDGVTTQSAIQFKNLPPAARTIQYNDMAFASTKNGVVPIKLVVTKEDENEQ